MIASWLPEHGKKYCVTTDHTERVERTWTFRMVSPPTPGFGRQEGFLITKCRAGDSFSSSVIRAGWNGLPRRVTIHRELPFRALDRAHGYDFGVDMVYQRCAETRLLPVDGSYVDTLVYNVIFVMPRCGSARTATRSCPDTRSVSHTETKCTGSDHANRRSYGTDTSRNATSSFSRRLRHW